MHTNHTHKIHVIITSMSRTALFLHCVIIFTTGVTRGFSLPCRASNSRYNDGTFSRAESSDPFTDTRPLSSTTSLYLQTTSQSSCTPSQRHRGWLGRLILMSRKCTVPVLSTVLIASLFRRAIKSMQFNPLMLKHMATGGALAFAGDVIAQSLLSEDEERSIPQKIGISSEQKRLSFLELCTPVGRNISSLTFSTTLLTNLYRAWQWPNFSLSHSATTLHSC